MFLTETQRGNQLLRIAASLVVRAQKDLRGCVTAVASWNSLCCGQDPDLTGSGDGWLVRCLSLHHLLPRICPQAACFTLLAGWLRRGPCSSEEVPAQGLEPGPGAPAQLLENLLLLLVHLLPRGLCVMCEAQ